jgi:type I restriction enzyme, S subunit
VTAPGRFAIHPLKYVASINTDVLPETTAPGREIEYVDIGSVDNVHGVIETQCMSFADSPSRARRVVQSGDTIVSTVRTYLRAIAFIGKPATSTVVSTGFAVLHPGPEVEPRFLFYAVYAQPFVEAVVARSVGVSYPAINPSVLGRLAVPVPSLSEQRAVAAYLDRETARIDALVAKKRRLIELLEERLNASVSSEVASRQSMRLKFLAKICGGIAKSESKERQRRVEMPYLRVVNVQDGYLNLKEIATIRVTCEDAEHFALRKGDVLMNEGGDNDKLGRGSVWHGEIAPCLHQNHVFAVRPNAGVDGEWLAAVTRTSQAKAFFMSRAKQTTNLASISATNIKNLPVPWPSELNQGEILKRVGAERARVDKLTNLLRRQLSHLIERRQALITAAITGQVDVEQEIA